MITRGAVLVAAAAIAVGFPGAAQAAATFTVNSTGDAPDANPGNTACATAGGACTVRAAIQESNALAGADKVVIPSGTYQLGSTLTVSTTIDIEGPAGARATILDGTGGARVITITGGGTMRFSGITLTGGGGGLLIDSADVTLDRVAVRDNSASGAGLLEGGGIFLSSGSLTISRSTIGNNVVESTAQQAIGGAISLGSDTTLTITNSTIANNRALAPASSAFGGGLSLRPSTTTVLRHVTLVGNVADGQGVADNGGNLYRQLSSAALTIGDSIVADGFANTGSNCYLAAAAITVTGRNLDSGTTCGFPAGHLNNTPAKLEPLADRGGPTDTMAPMTASLVRDAALACEPDGSDQRGVPAPTGSACDIGATELAADLATTLTPSRASVPSGGDATFVARVTNTGPDAAPSTVLDATLAAGSELVLAATSDGSCAGTHCDIGLLASGASATVTLVVRAPATGPFATGVRASSAHPDPDAADDSSSITTAVDAPTTTPPPGGGTTTPPPPDRTAPVLGALKAVGRIVRGRAGTLSTTLSEAAKLTLTVDRLVAGRRVGKRCKTGRKSGQRCTIARRVGSASATVASGAVRFKLPAKVAGRALARGRHRLTVVATDAAGNRSAARTLVITVR